MVELVAVMTPPRLSQLVGDKLKVVWNWYIWLLTALHVNVIKPADIVSDRITGVENTASVPLFNVTW